MKKLRGLVFFLFFYKCASLGSTNNIITGVGKKISLKCEAPSQKEILWNKDGSLVVKYVRGQKFQSNLIKDVSRFIISDPSICNMELNDAQLTDSGTYTCQKDKTILCSVKLIVFEVTPTPSQNLITSEDLRLEVKSSPEQVPGLQVHWMKDAKDLGSGMSIEFKSVTLEHSGLYRCQIKMEGGGEADASTEIKVNGMYSPSSEIVYVTKPKSVILPWYFNFKVRSTPMLNGVKVVEGSITYLSQVIKQLIITHGTASWPEDSATKSADMQRLDIHLSNPKTGDYKMEIDLELEGRRKKLLKNVCVANLTVSSSDDDFSMESRVTLLCQTNCLDENGRLCWQHMNMQQDICGPPGKNTWVTEVTVLPDTLGNWTCQVVSKEKMIVSTNLTLVLPAGLGQLLDTSGYLFWVVIGAGICILLVIVMIVAIMVARSRRRQRARKRAWLLQNIHQKRRCECKGFPPQQQPIHHTAYDKNDRYV